MPKDHTLLQPKMEEKCLFRDGGRAARKKVKSDVLLDDHTAACLEARALQMKQQILRLEQVR